MIWEFITWFFRRHFSRRDRYAFLICRQDKGYLSISDWSQVREGDHWAQKMWDGYRRLGKIPPSWRDR